MQTSRLSRFGLFLTLCVLFSAVPQPVESMTVLFERQEIDEWVPAKGDSLLVDTKDNIAYLVHSNGRFIRFPVATGQRRYVHWIGRTYFAATPNRTWIAKSKEYKGRSWTYGNEGLFLRLYYEDEKTPYGIHAYHQDRMHKGEEKRFRSMGCIVPTHAMLDVIRDTFDVNEGELPVTTQYGLDPSYFVMQ